MVSPAPVHTNLQHNKELARIFGQMADCYRYLGESERFRAIAYERASKTIANLVKPIDIYDHDIKKLDQLNGIGESIAAKILEYLDTGSIHTFELLKQKVPLDLLDLMDIESIGPAMVRILHSTLNIHSKEELADAIQAGKLENIHGFGEKKIRNLQRILKIGKDKKKRVSLTIAQELGNKLVQQISKVPGVIRVSLAGSIRRGLDTIGDIDIVVTAERKNCKRITQSFTKLPLVNTILAVGQTKASVLLKGSYIQADLRVVHDSEYGSAMLYFTGSKEHVIGLRTMAKKNGWKLNEYGIYELATGKKLAGETEKGIYALFGLPCFPPEKRTGTKELENNK